MSIRPSASLLLVAAFVLAPELPAQAARNDSIKAAQVADAAGRHGEARAIYQALVASAPDAAARAAAQRRLAMSYGYDANCAKVVELEEEVMAYWATRRAAEPQNAYNQEGSVANEAARVCIDHGFLDEAERMYRRGYELANLEPAPRTHPKSLWDFRLAHGLGRIAARRGNAAEAHRWVSAARHALDSDSVMAKDQEAYYPYLVGYVALFTNDLGTAETEFTKMTKAMPEDPFQLVLLGMTYEKQGKAAQAHETYQRAYEMSAGNTPPAIYSRVFTMKKLGLH
ncbi:MAG: hypothetical protein V4503_08250 [Gemmatimonadota bacterium]